LKKKFLLKKYVLLIQIENASSSLDFKKSKKNNFSLKMLDDLVILQGASLDIIQTQGSLSQHLKATNLSLTPGVKFPYCQH